MKKKVAGFLKALNRRKELIFQLFYVILYVVMLILIIGGEFLSNYFLRKYMTIFSFFDKLINGGVVEYDAQLTGELARTTEAEKSYAMSDDAYLSSLKVKVKTKQPQKRNVTRSVESTRTPKSVKRTENARDDLSK